MTPLQTVLQFMTGEIDEATVENSMKVNGRDETYAFTFRRSDIKPGFFVTMTGNKDTDGHSTHSLSRSAYSRINPLRLKTRCRLIGAPYFPDFNRSTAFNIIFRFLRYGRRGPQTNSAR